MPAKNIIKYYVEDSHYHLYNRGVEKRLIFPEKQDRAVFLSYLKTYLLPKNEAELRKKLADSKTHYLEKDKILKALRLNNFATEITLLSYCLMPNHFHLLVRQRSLSSIENFMRSLLTRYSIYFNKKYKRVGPLFQGNYKGVLVKNDNQLLHLSRYIHRQAIKLSTQGPTLREQSSSYPNYLGEISQDWVKPNEILAFFKKSHATDGDKFTSYRVFVEDYQQEIPEIIVKLTLED